MKRKGLFKLVGAISLAAVITIPFAAGCAAPAPVEEEMFTWRMQSPGTGVMLTYRYHKKMADYVREASDGRLNIEVYEAVQVSNL